jgi:spore maturation protein CgeB
MRVVLFVHSLVSDWNHGNAHFLRGVVAELDARGHDVCVLEPRDGWSRANLLADHGDEPLERFRERFPRLRSTLYDVDSVDLERVLDGADLVLVHEWNAPELVRRLGELRRRGSFRLLFHDTHHRAATAPAEMARYDLSGYDGVLAFGRVLRDLYLERSWAERAWTWHEAADARVFRPLNGAGPRRDLVWVGNWGDGERTAELEEFLLEPARALGLSGTVHGVRYPEQARRAVARSGLEYRGWLPNADAAQAFAAHRVTVHVPRRPYVRALPGIPTIRPFEALACGIPLVSAPWDDVEGLFTAGDDYLLARDGAELRGALDAVLHDDELAASLARHGLETIRARHTCAHRVDELLAICAELDDRPEEAAA